MCLSYRAKRSWFSNFKVDRENEEVRERREGGEGERNRERQREVQTERGE